MRALSILISSLALHGLVAAQTPRIEELRTPDGASFLLVPRPLGGVVHWASYSGIGRIHEAPDELGLAAACVRSSLAGSGDPTRIAPAAAEELDKADRLAQEIAELVARDRGDEGDALARLRRRLIDALAAADRSEPFDGLQQTLAALPATGIETETELYGSLLQARIARGQVLAFASLMERRRRDARLPTFQLELLRERERLAALVRRSGLAAGEARRALVVEAMLLAMRDHPLRRSLLPRMDALRAPTRAEALAFWSTYQRPERCVTVIIGDFDPERVREGLVRIFVRRPEGRAPLPLPRERAQTGLRVSELELPGPRRMVLAYRVPEEVRPAVLRTLAHLLGPGPGSLLGPLRLESGARRDWSVTPRQPAFGEPAFFVIESEERGEPGPFADALNTVLLRLQRGEASDDTLRRALRWEEIRQQALLEDSRALAAELARQRALTGRISLEAPSLADVRRGAALLLRDEVCTRVRSHPPAGEEGK